MILPKQYRCDTPGCTAVRTETNHWFAVTEDDKGIHLQTWIQAGDYETLNEVGTTHHCGQAHALKQVSLLLGEKI